MCVCMYVFMCIYILVCTCLLLYEISFSQVCLLDSAYSAEISSTYKLELSMLSIRLAAKGAVAV